MRREESPRTRLLAPLPIRERDPGRRGWAVPPLRPRGLLRSLRDEAVGWCRGRSWVPRAPLLLGFLWIFVRHLGNPTHQSLFNPLNLGIHELGHLVFGPFGRFPGLLGGSLAQCLAPAASAVMFLVAGDFFAIAVCCGWLSTNLFDVATYAGDARAMTLQLVTPFGGHPIHDWNYLLARLGLLEWDLSLALLLRSAATASMGLCLVGGGWLLWQMFRRNPLGSEKVA